MATYWRPGLGWVVIPKTPRVQTKEREINQLQFNILQSVDKLTANPISDGIIIEDIALTSAANPNEVNHNLGRELSGWLVIRNRAQSYLWDSQDSNTVAAGYKGPDNTLLLNTSANTNIDLYVF